MAGDILLYVEALRELISYIIKHLTIECMQDKEPFPTKEESCELIIDYTYIKPYWTWPKQSSDWPNMKK